MPIDHKIAKRLKEYTASAISTEGAVYKKVIASESEGDGAIEDGIKSWYAFMDYYRETDIFKHQGIHKLLGLNFFSGLEKTYKDESLETYTKNYIAMMIRRNIIVDEPLDKVWGTKWNCEHAVQFYFSNSNCFIMEGTNEKDKNIFQNGFTSDYWSINDVNIKDSSLFIEDAGLINVKGVRLLQNSVIKTHSKISIQNKEGDLYSMQFFIKCLESKLDISNCIEITFIHQENGTIFNKKYTNTSNYEWENKQEYIRLPSGEYDIIIKGLKSCNFDFFCLFPSVPYPSISLIVGHGGTRSGKAIFFAPGKADKVLNKNGEFIFTKDIKEGTHNKYKFWFPYGDDTTKEAKEGRKKYSISFDDPKWGYWTEDGNFISLVYLTRLLDVLIPVGVKVFDIALTKKI